MSIVLQDLNAWMVNAFQLIHVQIKSALLVLFVNKETVFQSIHVLM